MKKQLLFLPLTFASILPLTSCNGTSEKVDLKYGQMISEKITIIDYLSLKEKIDNKENFILSVYTTGCACWSNFRKVAEEYINTNHVSIYGIDYKNFRASDGSSLDTFSLTFVSGGVSVHIFKDGKKKVEIADSKSPILTKISALTSFLEENVILPKMFYVSLDQVDSLYKSSETSLIYFARSSCSDCQYLDNNFLKEYSVTNNLYILDCETIGVREYDDEGNLTPESATKWNQFKIDYGLAKDNNEKYGYDTGYVPSLFLIKGDGISTLPTFLSGSVYFNDEINKDDNGYYISNSYYTEERIANISYTSTILKGKRLTNEEVTTIGTYSFWNKEEASKEHNKLIKAFLDESLIKVTHKGFNAE